MIWKVTFLQNFWKKCKSNPWLFHHASRCYLTPTSRADRAGQSFSLVAGCSYSLLQASQLDFSSVSSKCYSPQHVVQLDFSWSITKYSTIQNVWFWKGRYGAEDRCNLVSHYQRVSNQFQLVCSVWLWELCEKSLFLRSNKKLLSIWFCKCFLAAKICTGALGQIWKMRLWRGGDCSKSTSTKSWTSETVGLREELNLYRG